MGWNSWDCFSWAMTERQLMETAHVMADRLLEFGYDTLVVDGGWMFPADEGGQWDGGCSLDEYGRHRPAPDRFPSTRDSQGFRPIADAIHALGLKFGIHVMRGIPRTVVKLDCPVRGTDFTSSDIVNRKSLCTWSTMMYGVQVDHPGSQAWYDGNAELWAEWGVDFIKFDDASSPYHAVEIEMLAGAIQRAGRPMVLSLSPGDSTPLPYLDHARAYAHMWRTTGDFWDRWTEDLRNSFDRMAEWAPLARPGAWPDADMLPFGLISLYGEEYGSSVRWSRFSPDEVRTQMTLWCIGRSPLMIGGHLSTMPEPTMALLTHPDLLRLNQAGENPREVARLDELIIWHSRVATDQYLAVFNVGETVAETPVRTGWWETEPTEPITDVFSATQLVGTTPRVAVPTHGVVLLRAG